ncbi:MAG: hypothetical protein H0T48_15335 [Gemmatimonadaceae bacterium]|nr:hypothetical protein [Gemmatimonadaceae bacterium]
MIIRQEAQIPEIALILRAAEFAAHKHRKQRITWRGSSERLSDLGA